MTPALGLASPAKLEQFLLSASPAFQLIFLCRVQSVVIKCCVANGCNPTIDYFNIRLFYFFLNFFFFFWGVWKLAYILGRRNPSCRIPARRNDSLKCVYFKLEAQSIKMILHIGGLRPQRQISSVIRVLWFRFLQLLPGWGQLCASAFLRAPLSKHY